MANPSSSHHRDRERERERHHHHRTISSTTLLLVLSLILAVLAVMLSLPSNRNSAANQSAEVAAGSDNGSGLWTYLSPRRSQALVAREHEVAVREAEVAKREAELLAGSVAGMPIPTPSLATCIPCSTTYTQPPETIIKEVFREVETIGGGRSPAEIRMEDVMQREEHVSEREKEVGKREETIGKRETDASRRENWIMEQLMSVPPLRRSSSRR